MESPWGECDEAQAELFAEQILLQREPIQPEQITSWLNRLPFPGSGRKINGACTRGFAIGATRCGAFSEISAATKKYPNGVCALIRLAKENLAIPWTACQINAGYNPGTELVNFQSAHVDVNCKAEFQQAVCAYGDYKGG